MKRTILQIGLYETAEGLYLAHPNKELKEENPRESIYVPEGWESDEWRYIGVDASSDSIEFVKQKYGEGKDWEWVLAGVGDEVYSDGFTCSLKDLLSRLGITGLDILAMDVEGHEFDIFRTYDFSIRPKCVFVEYHDTDILYDERFGNDLSVCHTLEKRQELTDIMSSHEYRVVDTCSTEKHLFFVDKWADDFHRLSKSELFERLGENNIDLPPQIQGGKCCIVFPCFCSDGLDRWDNIGLWNIKSFFKNTNIRDIGWDIFLYVDDFVRDLDSVQMLDDLGYVKCFQTIPSDVLVDGYRRTGQMVYPVIDSQFNKYDYVFVFDADLFISRVGNAPVFDLNNIISDYRGYSLLSAGLYKSDFWDNMRYLYCYREYLDESANISDETRYNYWSKSIKKLTGVSIERNSPIEHVVLSGGVHRFCPDTITDEFKEFIREAEPILGNNESVLIAWHLKTGYLPKSILREDGCPPMRGWLSHSCDISLDEFRLSNPVYLSHIYTDIYEKDFDQWESIIRSDVVGF